MHLRKQLLNLKLGNLSLQEYFQRFKSLSDQLGACGQRIAESDLIIHILDGLPAVYRPFASSIRARSSQIGIDELKSLLLCEEIALADEKSEFDGISAMYTQRRGRASFRSGNAQSSHWRASGMRGRRPPSPFHSTFGNSNTQSAGQYQRLLSKPICQICNKQGHIALDCFQRLNLSFTGKQPPEKLAAMASSWNPLDDSTWYTDSGATHHLTADQSNLMSLNPRQEQTNVQIANGQGLSVMNVGSSIVNVGCSDLKFKNILHCPKLACNLLSVHKLAKDNNCIVSFDEFQFFIKERRQGRYVIKGNVKEAYIP